MGPICIGQKAIGWWGGCGGGGGGSDGGGGGGVLRLVVKVGVELVFIGFHFE